MVVAQPFHVPRQQGQTWDSRLWFPGNEASALTEIGKGRGQPAPPADLYPSHFYEVIKTLTSRHTVNASLIKRRVSSVSEACVCSSSEASSFY